MPRAATLKDVATEAGVDVSTASRALNTRTRSVVNAETAERIQAAAERLGYQPHPLARGLRTSRTHMVGMVVPDLGNPLFPPIHAGAEAALSTQGYSLIIAGDDDDPVKAGKVLAALRGRRVDGLILATAHLDFRPPDSESGPALPTVLVNRAADGIVSPTVAGDDHAGIGLVVRHLRSLGHTAIAHVAGPQDLSTGLSRRQAFAAWMDREGLETTPELIVEAAAFRTAEGRAACERLLDSGVSFSAIVAGNDLIALGCYDALTARGLEVPRDVSVTGYNDMAFIDRIAPALTTVSVPYREMGAAAARELLILMERDGREASEQAVAATIRLTPSLVVRASTAAPPITAPTRST